MKQDISHRNGLQINMKSRFQNFIKIVFVFFCLLLAYTTQAQMNQLLNTFGQYQVRADACGTNGISCPITIEKPANATTVHKAYIYYANNPKFSDQGSNAISISGGGLPGGIVPMTNLTSSGTDPTLIGITRYEDVTTLFAPGLNGATAGTNIVYTSTEAMTGNIEGVGIIVVWNNPTVANTAIHVSIGSSLTDLVVTDSIITSAINTTLPFFSATLGLGISFSTGYAPQISTASINGAILDNNVGGYEDGGILVDGGLITLGGFGDSKTTLDDEYYDFASFIPNGSTLIKYEITGYIDDWVNVVYFEVVGIDPGGVDSTTVLIEVLDESSIFIPNVFTPNKDGSNDVFGANGINLKSEEGEIYNRWGQKIFYWLTVGGFWDGGDASDGTYYYIIKATGIDGNEYNEKGSFTLIR